MICVFFQISEIISKKCACIYSCNCKCLDDTYANFMSHLYKLVYETFTSFEEFLTDRYSHLYQSSNEHDQDMLQEKLDHLLDHQEPKSMRENEQQALMEKTQGIDLKNCDLSSSEEEQEKLVHQEPISKREKEYKIIREYINNWKTSLENGLRKAKDYVLTKSSCRMKRKFKELKELREFDRMLKSSAEEFEVELSKVS